MDKKVQRRTESEDLFGSLQQLEPSPVESPEFEEPPPDLPRPGLIHRSSTLGLSGNGHGSVYHLSRLQKYSSYVFTIYTAAHITNTSLIPLITRSIPESDRYLLLTRPYYQSFPFEPLLIVLPLACHIGSGIALRLIRRNEALTRYGASNLSISKRLSSKQRIWPPLSTISLSGYMMSAFVAVHVYVNRIIPLQVEGGSSSVGLGFVAHGFAKHPFLAWSTYLALVGVGVGHMVWGWAKWMGWSQVVGTGGNNTAVARKGKQRWWVINGIALGIASLWAAGGLGVVARGGRGTGWIAKNWDILYAEIPFLKL